MRLVVWRDTAGAALRTYASTENKTPMSLEDEAAAQEARAVDANELRELVSGRQPFDKVLITPEDARHVLGWDV